MKKIFVILMCVILLFSMSMAACNSDEKPDKTDKTQGDSAAGTNADGTPIEKEPLVVTVWQPGDPTNPPKMSREDGPGAEKWFDLAEAYMGRKIIFEFDWINYGEAVDKQRVYLSTGIKHDIIVNMLGDQEEQRLGERGLIVDITKHDIPYYGEILDSLDGLNRKVIQNEDGSIYGFAVGSISPWEGSLQQTIYRFDILKKHNLKPPKDLNELYVLLKELKSLYPDSYPLGADRKATDYIFAVNKVPISSMFLQTQAIHFDGEKYFFAPFENPEMFKETLAYCHKLYAEGLLDPDFLSQTQEQWIQKALTGKTFVIGGYYALYLNNELVNPEYPDVEWGVAPIPLGLNGEKGWKFWTFYKGAELLKGSNRWVNAKSDNVEEVVKLFDYKYSPEMLDLASWGIEGLTYTVDEKGVKNFIPEIMNLPTASAREGKLAEYNATYEGPSGGLSDWEKHVKLWGTIPYFDGTNFISAKDSKLGCFEFSEIYDAGTIKPDDREPAKLVKISAAENALFANIINPVQTYLEENMFKFIRGDRNLSEFDTFLDELRKQGDIDSVLSVYNEKVEKVK